jgi:hypothetical protein
VSDQHYCAACSHPLLENDFRHICQNVLEDRVRELQGDKDHLLAELKARAR